MPPIEIPQIHTVIVFHSFMGIFPTQPKRFFLRLTWKLINEFWCKSSAKTNLQTKWNVTTRSKHKNNSWAAVSILQHNGQICPKEGLTWGYLKAKFVTYGHMQSTNQSPTNSSIQDILRVTSQWPSNQSFTTPITNSLNHPWFHGFLLPGPVVCMFFQCSDGIDDSAMHGEKYWKNLTWYFEGRISLSTGTAWVFDCSCNVCIFCVGDVFWSYELRFECGLCFWNIFCWSMLALIEENLLTMLETHEFGASEWNWRL